MDLKIIGWTDYDSNFPSIEIANEEVTEVFAIVVKEIRDGGYMFSAEDHQCAFCGVPVFDNGTCFRASMRAWGIVMSAAYPEIDGRETNYMDFYMSSPKETKLPKMLDVDIKPMESDNFNGLITPQDGEMISQSLQMGIPFMTTDKALNYIMDGIKEMQDLTSDDEDDN